MKPLTKKVQCASSSVSTNLLSLWNLPFPSEEKSALYSRIPKISSSMNLCGPVLISWCIVYECKSPSSFRGRHTEFIIHTGYNFKRV